VRIFALVFVSAAAAALFAASAAAHFDATSKYTYAECPAAPENRVDPINVVFTAWGTWGRSVSQIESHTGWADTSGSGQAFVDHGTCYPMHAQRASREGSRFHIRVRGQHVDTTLGWTSTGDAHHEDLVLFPVPCGHAVDSSGPNGSGFDQGRDEPEARFASAGHQTRRVWWGNTHSFKQCDGDYAASDGWTLFVELHQVNH
jgi:hypothetical protein